MTVYKGDNPAFIYLQNKKKFIEKLYPTEYPGYYVTETGRVYRDPHKIFNGKKCTERVEVGQHLRGGGGSNLRQYPSINISLKTSEGKTLRQKGVYVHRLIAETLIPNPLGYKEIEHIDRNKHNNNRENLSWVTRKQNQSNRG